MFTLALALSFAAEPLPVPADSLAVVQVRGLGHVRQQLAGLANAVAPDKAAGFVQKLDELFTPDVFALDVTRRGYVSVIAVAGGVTWAAYLPTTDRDRSRTAVARAGRELVMVDGPEGYLIVTPSAAVAARLKANPKPLTVAALGDAADVFLGSDLGVFVNLSAVQKQYGGLLAGTRLMLPAMLMSGAFGLPKLDARQAGQIATVVDGVIQCVADGSGFAVGVKVGPTGVTVEAALAVRPGTTSAKVLAGERPHPMPLLDALPGGQSAYAAGRFGAELAKRIRTAFPESAPADPLATWAANGWAMAGAAPGPVLEVCRPERPDGWLRAMRDAYDRAEVVQNVPLKGRPTWLRQSELYHGRVFDRLGLTFDLDAATVSITDDGIRQAAHTTMKALVGERSDQWLAIDLGTGLRVSAADWPAARRLVDAFLGNGLKACHDPAVTAIRRRLPAEASAVVLLDAAAFTCKVGELVRGAVEELPAFPGLDLPTFVPPAGRSSFLGLAVVTEQFGCRATLVLPADALRASLATVKP